MTKMDGCGVVAFGLFVLLGSILPVLVLFDSDHPAYENAVLAVLLFVVLVAGALGVRHLQEGGAGARALGTIISLGLIVAAIVWMVQAGIVLTKFDEKCPDGSYTGGRCM